VPEEEKVTNKAPSLDTAAIRAELDTAHNSARQAYARRDAAAYMAMCHPDLEYQQADGKIIGWESLAGDVRTQLSRVAAASSEFQRETLEVDEDGITATEVCEQRATYEVRAFGLLHREWSVRRRGRYKWVRVSAGWRIRRVEVLAEDMRSRWWFGRSAV
jgi:hypothetical protein